MTKRDALYQSYLEMEDITEHRFAMEHFGSYDAWLAYVGKNEPMVRTWRKELELKLRGEAYQVVQTTMRSGGKEALQAAKFLLGRGVLSRDGEASLEATEEEVIDHVKNPVKEQVTQDWLRLVK